jgi:hypothetical protein
LVHLYWIGVINPHQFAPSLDQSITLTIDMAVVKTDRSKAEFTWLAYDIGFALGGVSHTIGALVCHI